MSDVDITLEKFPLLKKYFYIIERRGWEGMNLSKQADIKLVEDSSTLEETKKIFPDAILLDIAGADFVDTDKFKPINIEKKYNVIQISAWQEFKRPQLFFDGIKLLPKKNFLKFGHLISGGDKELNYRNKFVNFSKVNQLNVELPFSDLKSNNGLPNDPNEVNVFINQAKMGIITSKVEGINRFKLECLSANIPVLVPNDANIPLKKHVTEQTGVLYEPTPEGLAEAIKKLEKNYDSFAPRNYVLQNTGISLSIEKLRKALISLSKRDGGQDIYNDISYDGRNQSLIWEEKAEIFITDLLRTITEVQK